MVCTIKNLLFQQIGPVAPLEDDKTSPEMANLIEQEVKRFTKVTCTSSVHLLEKLKSVLLLRNPQLITLMVLGITLQYQQVMLRF